MDSDKGENGNEVGSTSTSQRHNLRSSASNAPANPNFPRSHQPAVSEVSDNGLLRIHASPFAFPEADGASASSPGIFNELAAELKQGSRRARDLSQFAEDDNSGDDYEEDLSGWDTVATPSRTRHHHHHQSRRRDGGNGEGTGERRRALNEQLMREAMQYQARREQDCLRFVPSPGDLEEERLQQNGMLEEMPAAVIELGADETLESIIDQQIWRESRERRRRKLKARFDRVYEKAMRMFER